ncbi:MAG: hypothetical protein WBL61_15040 [Bryobacteraceae bacterium]
MPRLTDTAIPARWLVMGFVAALNLSLGYPALSQNATTQALSVRAPEPVKPESVKEETFVRIGGIDQWITIKGDDRNNPVVLFLHGGPGDALSPFADAMFAGWEKNLTLVQWDQRGAGRTYRVVPILTRQPFRRMKCNSRDAIMVERMLGSDPWAETRRRCETNPTE